MDDWKHSFERYNPLLTFVEISLLKSREREREKKSVIIMGDSI